MTRLLSEGGIGYMISRKISNIIQNSSVSGSFRYARYSDSAGVAYCYGTRGPSRALGKSSARSLLFWVPAQKRQTIFLAYFLALATPLFSPKGRVACEPCNPCSKEKTKKPHLPDPLAPCGIRGLVGGQTRNSTLRSQAPWNRKCRIPCRSA
jgi:hypothetical protein